MDPDPTNQNRPSPGRLPKPNRSLPRLLLVAILLAAALAGFAYEAGWLTPHNLTPADFVPAFEGNGSRPGFRLNHAKGVCVSGSFESNGNGVAICKATVLRKGTIPVVGRFSLGGAMPFQPDTFTQVRGLGLQLTAPDGAVWRTAMINFPVFPLPTPEAFYDMLIASHPDPATGKPDPAKIQAFMAANPETAAALKIIKAQPPSAGFTDSTFHSLNAFIFTSPTGASTPVRWIFEPAQSASPAPFAPANDKNFLFDDLIAQLARGPLHWHLILVVGQLGDPTNDATLPWPPTRRRIDAGTLTIDQIESDDTSPTALLNFDPLVLPDGIAPSDDPLLSARSAVYSASFTYRSGAPKPPSAVTPPDIQSIESRNHPGG
jgi:catalase